MQKIALPFVACLLAFAATAQAQALWKWRDASGQMHISDKAPPPGTPAKNIISSPAGAVAAAPVLTAASTSSTSTTTTTTTTAAAPAGNAPASAPESALEKKKKAADKERAEKDAADRAALDAKNAAIRKDNCSRAQSSLAGLQSGVRIAKTKANGEREILDDAGRADETRRANDAIAANCGAAPAGQ